ncbi:MAG TPA: hypothetical protein VME86_00265 [Acidobacteriaceae bacterium]|nr:hypothetical protein [Acidobacteriaceae bacterium]
MYATNRAAGFGLSHLIKAVSHPVSAVAPVNTVTVAASDNRKAGKQEGVEQAAKIQHEFFSLQRRRLTLSPEWVGRVECLFFINIDAS